MSEPLVKYEIFDYKDNDMFLVINIYESRFAKERLLSHWHEELEITYIINGGYNHYIDGTCVKAEPGRLIVTNAESVHNMVEEHEIPDDTYLAVMLILSKKFLEAYYPEYKSFYFTNEKRQCCDEIKDIMLQLSEYNKLEKNNFTEMNVKGLILQLLYYMSIDGGVVERENKFDVNYLKNIERLKGVLSYVENHYTEPIHQAEIAEKYYFTKEYFARYFKKCTGMTFMEYLKEFRVQKAQNELLSSDRSIVEIALNNGFSDERRFILAFKQMYHMTPFQYRKMVQSKKTVQKR